MNQSDVQLYFTELVQINARSGFCPGPKIRHILRNRSVRYKKTAASAKAEGNLKFLARFGILHNTMCKLHK